MNSNKFFTGKVIVNLISLVVILVTIPVGIYLTTHKQTIQSSAATPDQTHIEIFGPNVKNNQTSSRDIQVRLTYVPASQSAFPVSFRIANSKEALPYSQEQLFSQNNQEINWRLNSAPGLKVVYVQFKVVDSWTDPDLQTVNLNATPLSAKFELGSNLADINIKPEDLDKQLKILADSGIKDLRVFVGRSDLTDDQSASNLNAFLTLAESHQLSVIPVLIDDYSTNFHPQSTNSYYNQLSSLDYTFFDQGYEDTYLEFVKKVVTLNMSHSNILAWEIGNELANKTNSTTLINFFKTTSAVIKGLDPDHDVALGVTSSASTSLLPLQLYTNLDNIDLVTIHLKAGQPRPIEDLNWAKQHQRAVLVEDTNLGDSKDKSLSDKISSEESFWQNQGVSSFFTNTINSQ